MRFLTAVALGSISALLAWPVQAATVFNNYTGVSCNCGFVGPALYASGFTPTGDYDFTGASAFVENDDFPNNAAHPFSMALYSSTASGTPDSSLWTSSTLSAPGPFEDATHVTASYSGPAILLQSGVEYFLVLNFPNGFVDWLQDGPHSIPFYSSSNGGSSWLNIGPSLSQLQIFGTSVSLSPVPEPSTWAMMLIGLAGLGFAGARRARSNSDGDRRLSA